MNHKANGAIFTSKYSMLDKILTLVMLVLFITQPILVSAQVVADPNAPTTEKPKITNVNGTPIVKIATPSSAGVSHNMYS